LALVSFVFSSASAVAAKEPDQEEKEIRREMPRGQGPAAAHSGGELGRGKGLARRLKDEEGKALWTESAENDAALKEIFESVPRKTKLEQFFPAPLRASKELGRLSQAGGGEAAPDHERAPGRQGLHGSRLPQNDYGVELKRDDGNRPRAL
jgi:hypothetical protein